MRSLDREIVKDNNPTAYLSLLYQWKIYFERKLTWFPFVRTPFTTDKQYIHGPSPLKIIINTLVIREIMVHYRPRSLKSQDAATLLFIFIYMLPLKWMC